MPDARPLCARRGCAPGHLSAPPGHARPGPWRAGAAQLSGHGTTATCSRRCTPSRSACAAWPWWMRARAMNNCRPWPMPGVVGMRLNLIGLPLPDLNAPVGTACWSRPTPWAGLWSCTCRPSACRTCCQPCWRPAAAWWLTTSGVLTRPLGSCAPCFGLLQQADSGRVWSSCLQPTASGRPPTAPPRAGRPPRNCCRPSRPGGCSGAATGRTRSTPARPAIRRPCAGCQDWLDDAGPLQAVLGRTAFELFRFQNDMPNQGDTP